MQVAGVSVVDRCVAASLAVGDAPPRRGVLAPGFTCSITGGLVVAARSAAPQEPKVSTALLACGKTPCANSAYPAGPPAHERLPTQASRLAPGGSRPRARAARCGQCDRPRPRCTTRYGHGARGHRGAARPARPRSRRPGSRRGETPSRCAPGRASSTRRRSRRSGWWWVAPSRSLDFISRAPRGGKGDPSLAPGERTPARG